MNILHSWICASSRWRAQVEREIIPWTLEGLDLGDRVLELGPGYGATTAILSRRAAHLTCVECDPKLARKLQVRAPNVTVRCADATAMPLETGAFDSVVCFTMLHHVPSAALQDRLLAEAARVLRPGGIFAGRDSRYSRTFGLLHLFDTMTVVDPQTFPARLEAAGFTGVRVDLSPSAFRFRATKR